MSFVENEACFSQARVIPVLAPLNTESGVAVGRVLFEAGLRVQEITLRTAVGLEVIATLRRELPELIVGAGTVVTPKLGREAVRAGARFLVSPGTTEALLQFVVTCPVPFLPGVATVSEMMRVQALGCTVAKLFPAQCLGGITYLKAAAGPLPSMRFCPTGGIDQELAPNYLALTNVLAVGGSWMAPPQLVAENRWADIRRLAEHAAAL